MDKFVIRGGEPLLGTVRVSGAKNAALPCMAAALLTDQPVILENIPQVRDIQTTRNLLAAMGADVELGYGRAHHRTTIHCAKLAAPEASYELVKTMRASTLVLGPLVARCGRARVSLPGGCAIGARPIDLHIKGLEKLGAKITQDHGYIEASATRLKGAEIVFDKITVTGTEDLLMAATLADGETVLQNCAREPEVEDLADLLNKTSSEKTPLQKQLDRFQGSTLLSNLRTLRAALADKNKMPSAFRQAEALLPALRQEAPHLLPRLAACFYWAVLETGPDDVLRYQRVFGKPPDDPNFHRLYALGYEKAGELGEAHVRWQQYEREIADHPERWPGDQADHARALIWLRMGENAASVPEPRRGQRRRGFDPFGDDEDTPLDPPAEKCFQKSLELAADQLETHEALVRHHLEAGREGKAEKAARQLLKQFPDHVPTLELLSDLRRKRGEYTEALNLAGQALQGNPLDRNLRRKVSDTHLLLARQHVEGGSFDEARQSFQAALDLSGGPDGSIILAHWAACEFKASDPARAEDLLQQALSRTPAAVGIAYLLLTEVIRLNLDRALKKRFEQDFKDGLAEPNQAGAVFLTRILAAVHAGGVSYLGQKGHTQKVLSYIHKARDLDFGETQLEELCQNLLDLEAYPRARRFADIGERQYPQNPFFPYLHALAWIRSEGRRFRPYQVVPLLQNAQRLAKARPPDERRDLLLDDIERHLHELNPFDLDFLGRLFDLGDFEDDDDDGW